MSVDERLRAALHEQALSVSPEVDTALEGVRARGRRNRRRSTAASLAGLAAAAAAVVGLVVQMQAPERGRGLPAVEPTPSPVATTTPGSPLRGWVTGVVTEPAVLAGTWSLELKGNATMVVEPPRGLAEDVGAAFFTADASSFRTTLFSTGTCSGRATGIYRWLAVGERIVFEEVSDTCPARARFFEATVWTVSTGPASRG